MISFDPVRHGFLRKKDLNRHKKNGRRYSVAGVQTTNQIQAPQVKSCKSSKKNSLTTHLHPKSTPEMTAFSSEMLLDKC